MGNIVWIASYPKSGNTWMRFFLHQYLTDGRVLNPNKVYGSARNENDRAFYAPFLASDPMLATNDELAAVRPQAQRLAAKQGGEGPIFLKTHNFFGHHAGTPTILPEVSRAAVQIVRDPRDVVTSYAAFVDVDFDRAIDTLLERDGLVARAPGGSYMVRGSWVQHVSSWVDQTEVPTLVVRYEDLLSDPLVWFGKVLDHVGLDRDEAKLERAVRATGFENLKLSEELMGFAERPKKTERFFRSGQAGEGRQKLSAAQQQRIIDECGSLMQRLGYDLGA